MFFEVTKQKAASPLRYAKSAINRRRSKAEVMQSLAKWSGKLI
jgi:hypothetical protein